MCINILKNWGPSDVANVLAFVLLFIHLSYHWGMAFQVQGSVISVLTLLPLHSLGHVGRPHSE